MNNMDITIDRWEPDSPMISVERFKRFVNKMPDDGQIRIEVRKDYGDRERLSLERIDAFALKGKVLVIGCTTKV